MLRFIYVGDQITEDEKAFAFFDTVYGRFIEFNDCQVFSDWEDFLLWRKDEENKYHQHDLKRFWSITPEEIRPTLFAPDPPSALVSADDSNESAGR